jgi:membrane-bound lytic murein transglycosylase D
VEPEREYSQGTSMQSPPSVTEYRIGDPAQPQAQPVPQTPPYAQPVPAQNEPGYITLQPGETLSYISVLYGVSEKDLMAWNGMNSPRDVRAGQRLAIRPPYTQHYAHSAPPVQADGAGASAPQTPPVEPAPSGLIIVAPGQSLSGIARSYGVTTAQLREWNGLTSDKIRAGQSLRIQPPPPVRASGSLGAPAATGRAAPPPQAEPARAAAPPLPDAPDASGLITVQPGQHLSGIAAKYGVSTGDLRQWNKLKSDQLKSGQKLRVQAPVRVHTVKAGESLNGIAAKYKVSPKALMQKNTLTNADMLPVGKELIIP